MEPISFRCSCRGKLAQREIERSSTVALTNDEKFDNRTTQRFAGASSPVHLNLISSGSHLILFPLILLSCSEIVQTIPQYLIPKIRTHTIGIGAMI
ncbi:hypothetical protein MPTK1_7g12860 [Marchantia polymorpha subsp. ruderalis]